MTTIFDKASETFSYVEFCSLAEKLLNESKTTGDNQSPEYLHYARLNLKRMQRWDKVYELPQKMLAKVKDVQNQTWYVITEAWCGDSAQNLPLINKLAIASEGKIQLKIVLRDENPEIINQYLTNGSKSIPILVAFNEQGDQIFKWGPRPIPAHQILMAWKNSENPKPFEDFEIEMQQWYNQDKGVSLMKELEALLS
jgi:hypothetical protein